MLSRKTLLLFLLKASLLYGFLSLPFSFYDEYYGKFYRETGKLIFGKFRDDGVVLFNPKPGKTMTHINIGNKAQVKPNGSFDTAATDINTRYLGYIPAILILSLVLASPVPWKRKLLALIAGLILVTLLVLFKQWISLLWLCETNSWLNLTHFGPTGKKILEFSNKVFCESSSTVLYFVVGIWLLVTFRLDDFKTSSPASPGKAATHSRNRR